MPGFVRLGSLVPWLQAAVVASIPAVDLSNLNRELGPCVCDLTPDSCDVNCCCDPKCTALQQTNFDCLPPGPPDNSGVQCWSTKWLASANPRVDFRVIVDDLAGALCVVVDNNPVSGVFFQNQATQAASAVSTAAASQRLSSFATAGSRGFEAPDRGFGSYLDGDVMEVHMAFGNNVPLTLVNGADSLQSGTQEVMVPLQLPVANAEGGCSSGAPLRFMEDWAPTTCWQTVNLATACLGSLSPMQLAQLALPTAAMQLGATCSINPSYPCIAPKVSSCPIPVLNPDGSVSSVPCSVTDVIAAKVLSDPIFLDANTSCSCNLALREVRHTFVYGLVANAVQISRWNIDVVLQNVTSPGCGLTKVLLSSSASFVQSAPGAPARSGNPGYLVGKPLLSTSCQTIVGNDVTKCTSFGPIAPAAVPGLLPDGRCALLSPVNVQSSARRRPVINFGEDGIFGCVLQLNRSELSDLCDKGAQAGGFFQKFELLKYGFQVPGTWTHLAAWGNVSQSSQDSADWIPVTAPVPSESPKFSPIDLRQASNSTCRDIMIGVDVQVGYSFFGSVRNPQAKIVAATMTPRLGVLSYTSMDPSVKQTFQFTYTVSYVKIQAAQDPITLVPPRPQPWPNLPNDLFYPFSIGGSGRLTPLHSLVLGTALWAMLWR